MIHKVDENIVRYRMIKTLRRKIIRRREYCLSVCIVAINTCIAISCNTSDSDKVTETDTDNSITIPGWENAKQIPFYITPSSNEENEKENPSMEIGATQRGEMLSIVASDIDLYWSWYYNTSYLQKKDSTVEILISFRDDGFDLGGLPDIVRFRTIVEVDTEITEVKIFTFFSLKVNEDGNAFIPDTKFSPELIGTVDVKNSTDCSPLIDTCEADTDCVATDLDHVDYYLCYSVSECNEKLCLWDSEYNWIDSNLK